MNKPKRQFLTDMTNLLDFLRRYRYNGEWHSLASDAQTKATVVGLAELGLIVVNEFGQVMAK